MRVIVNPGMSYEDSRDLGLLIAQKLTEATIERRTEMLAFMIERLVEKGALDLTDVGNVIYCHLEKAE